MKHRLQIFALILLAIVLLSTGCAPSNQKQYLAICGRYAVPGMQCSDLKENSYVCEVMEKDSYGRILYSFCAPNIFSAQSETAVIICQKVEKKSVWYYENACYLLGNWSDDDIVKLKEVNDWGKPLDAEKMVGRTCEVTLDGYLTGISTLDYYDVQEAFCHSEGIAEEQISDGCFLDANGNGLWVYWFAVGGSNGTSYYFVLADEDYQVMVCHAEKGLESIETLVAFQNENGW